MANLIINGGKATAAVGAPLYTKCGLYYIENIMSRTKLRCVLVRTESRKIAKKIYQGFLDEGYSPDLIKTKLDDWEEIERNKVWRG